MGISVPCISRSMVTITESGKGNENGKRFIKTHHIDFPILLVVISNIASHVAFQVNPEWFGRGNYRRISVKSPMWPSRK